MSVLTTSWRGSLLATAFCAMLGNSPSTASADDNPTSPPTSADREAMQAKFRAIREKAAQLDEQGNHDAADRLRREAKEMMNKSGAAAGDSRVMFVTPGNPEHEKIMARLKEMGQKIAQLESDGKHDEAEHLKNEAKELYGKFAASQSHNSVSLNVPSAEQQKLREHYMAMQEKIAAAKKQGNEELIRALQNEMEALRAMMQEREAFARAQYSTGGGDREARLNHLRAAAENLKAAGCEAEAKHVMDLIGHMEAEARASDTKAYHPELYNPAVQELRSQIEQMRREMRQMRADLDRAKSGGPPANGPFNR